VSPWCGAKIGHHRNASSRRRVLCSRNRDANAKATAADPICRPASIHVARTHSFHASAKKSLFTIGTSDVRLATLSPM